MSMSSYILQNLNTKSAEVVHRQRWLWYQIGPGEYSEGKKQGWGSKLRPAEIEENIQQQVLNFPRQAAIYYPDGATYVGQAMPLPKESHLHT